MATITAYGSKHSHEFKLTVNEASTDIANNTSTINFSFTIYKSGYSWSGWNSITYTITINGTSYTGTIPAYTKGTTLTIKSGTQTISHNDDGKKTISCSFSVNDSSGQSYTCGNASASGTVELSTIPRTSTINNFYGNDIEDYFSVNYTSHYSGFTNKLRLSIPNVKELENFNYTSGQTFKLSTNTINYLYEYMKNTKTVKIGAVIETWNGSTKIGESVELTNTCTISDCEPTIDSASYLDSNSTTVKITGNNQQIVRNQSILTIKLTNLKSFKNATLSKCTATINGITKSFSNITGTSVSNVSLDFGTLDISSNTKLTITLTDSRGYSVTKELDIKIINYIDLSINATVKRTQPTTGEVSVTFSGNYFNGNLGNTANQLTMKWFYKELGATKWIEGGNITPVIKDNTYSNGTTAISLGKIFDYQKSYNFYLEVKDKLITLEPSYSITQGIPIFNWGKDFFNVYGELLINNDNVLDRIAGTTLYNNSSGTTGTVTLSETSANFSYLEIFYIDSFSNKQNSKRISLGVSKNFILDGMVYNNASLNYSTNYTINEKNITVSSCVSFNRNYSSGTIGGDTSTNYVKIYRVIGYR